MSRRTSSAFVALVVVTVLSLLGGQYAVKHAHALAEAKRERLIERCIELDNHPEDCRAHFADKRH